MQKAKPADSPDAYVAALTGWRRECVVALRKTVRASADLEEVVKWGHLVYLANGPLLLIRAEEDRVLFGFWRGQPLQKIEPRLKRGGKYEMATLELREGMTVSSAIVRRLTQESVALNERLGDPTLAAKKSAAKDHVHYHKDGTVWARGQLSGSVMTGYWEWYRKDGSLMRSGSFARGGQVGEWTTYDRTGGVVKVTKMKPKAQSS